LGEARGERRKGAAFIQSEKKKKKNGDILRGKEFMPAARRYQPKRGEGEKKAFCGSIGHREGGEGKEKINVHWALRRRGTCFLWLDAGKMTKMGGKETEVIRLFLTRRKRGKYI